MSKKIEGVARKPCGSQGCDNRRRTGDWNHRDAMRMRSGYEKMAGVGDEGGATIRDERNMTALS
jgi:hypothetical protein